MEVEMEVVEVEECIYKYNIYLYILRSTKKISHLLLPLLATKKRRWRERERRKGGDVSITNVMNSPNGKGKEKGEGGGGEERRGEGERKRRENIPHITSPTKKKR